MSGSPAVSVVVPVHRPDATAATLNAGLDVASTFDAHADAPASVLRTIARSGSVMRPLRRPLLP